MVHSKKRNKTTFFTYLKQRLGVSGLKVKCDNELISRLIAQITLNEYIEAEIHKMIKSYKKQFSKHADFKDFIKKHMNTNEEDILKKFVEKKKHEFKYNKKKSENRLFKDFKLNMHKKGKYNLLYK